MTRPHASPSSSSTSLSLSSTQLLLNAIQVKSPTKKMIPAIMLMNAIKPKSVYTTEHSATGTTSCESEKKSNWLENNSTNAEASSKALKKLLVISTETASTPSSTTPRATSTVSPASTPVKTTIKQSTAASAKSTAAKQPSAINQKEKIIKICKERTKSRSNSEDADFYAGSAILNSPSPQAIPLPDFDESYDFFSTVENLHSMSGARRLSLVR